ncbi:Pentatricopeptide repeat-containing protein [Acorus gramineus]|uniref:Pentatricopeptide repeat-containing protein n=1 Tax=Acorus gramineus TaxID=55184 RepID=A0AAV9BTB7_ACOGR|nr:Pentatricopeptide repeat-containing protein [Acorus gramineus]
MLDLSLAPTVVSHPKPPPRIRRVSRATSQVLARIYKSGHDKVTFTKQLRFLGESGRVTEARELFSLMRDSHDPDVVAFTVLIRILCYNRLYDPALDLLFEMRRYCVPDVYCYNVLIDGLGRMRDQRSCVRWILREMARDGVTPDVVTYGSLVKLLCTMGEIGEAVVLLRQMEASEKVRTNTYVYNTVIKAYLDRARVREARGVLARMGIQRCEPDLCSFNLFIKHYSDAGQGLEAFELMKEMKQRRIEASEASYRLCIVGLVKEEKIEEAMGLIEAMKVAFLRRSISVKTWNTLLSWLGKMGRLNEAYKVFDEIERPDEVTFNIVIDMFYKHGKSELAWLVFRRMDKLRIDASIITCNVLVNGLVSEGRINDAIRFVGRMESQFSVSPDVVTYNCVLNGMCKAGNVDRACEFILEMVRRGCRPDLVSYNTLINGLIRVGRVEDACVFFENLKVGLVSHGVALETLVLELLEKRKL